MPPIEDGIRDYYQRTIREHGDSPRGVDWKNAESQTLRFERIAALLPGEASALSVLDVGCGTGAFLSHLKAGTTQNFPHFTGIDLVPEMIHHAALKHPEATFACTDLESFHEPHDCVVASGIFNVRGETPADEWHDWMWRIIDRMARLSRQVCIFNVLTSHVDYTYPRLFHANPAEVIDQCIRRYSRRVVLDHGYPLFEFTAAIYRDTKTPA